MLVLTFLLAVSPRVADALTVQELVCQQSIGKESLRFLTRAQKVSRVCEDAEAGGGTCDSLDLEAAIAAAAERLVAKLAFRCGPPIVLEHLGFPGLCSDDTGAPFDVADLTGCLEAAHRATIELTIAGEYPGAPGTLEAGALRCQRTIGGAGTRFLARRVRSRQSCLNDQLSGRIAADVDCRAQVPPAGPGTGAAKTDRRLAAATARLEDLLVRDCAAIDLGALGFPAGCPDAGGPPFTIDDLVACIRDGHADAADDLIDVEYPPG